MTNYSLTVVYLLRFVDACGWQVIHHLPNVEIPWCFVENFSRGAARPPKARGP